MGFAAAPATRNALAPYGVKESGVRWKWAPGPQGFTFPPHLHINGQFRTDEGDFDALPGEDVNGDKCLCWLVPLYRTPDGRIAKGGLEPLFLQPGQRVVTPVTAAQSFQPFDLQPLIDVLAVERPVNVALSLPQGSVVVNVPPMSPPDVIVNVPKTPLPTVQVDVAAPNVEVAAPSVTVAAPNVTVAAPSVKVEPRIEVKPAPVKIIREKVAKAVRFRRNSSGQIEEATVTEETT